MNFSPTALPLAVTADYCHSNLLLPLKSVFTQIKHIKRSKGMFFSLIWEENTQRVDIGAELKFLLEGRLHSGEAS